MPHIDKYYKYEPLPYYPHMGPRDADIWNKFVYLNPGFFDRCIYDMRVGQPEKCDPSLPKNIQDAWADLCRGRIDVVAERDNSIFIIEVKPRARGEALGQAIANAHLYVSENNPTLPVIPAVVTDVILPGTKIVAEAKGVAIWTP